MGHTSIIQPAKIQPIRDGIAAGFGYYSRPPYAKDKPLGEQLENGLVITQVFYALTDLPGQGPRSRFVVAEGRYARDARNNNTVQAYIVFQQRETTSAPWQIKEIWSAAHFSRLLENLTAAEPVRPDNLGFIARHTKVAPGLYTDGSAPLTLKLHLSPDPVRKAVSIFRDKGLVAVDPDQENIWRFRRPQDANRIKALSVVNAAGEWQVHVEQSYHAKNNEPKVWRKLNVVPMNSFLRPVFRNVVMPLTQMLARAVLPLDPARDEGILRTAGFDEPAQTARRKEIVEKLNRQHVYERPPTI